MRRLERRQNPFETAEQLERRECFGVAGVGVVSTVNNFALARYHGSSLYDAREREPPSRVAPFR